MNVKQFIPKRFFMKIIQQNVLQTTKRSKKKSEATRISKTKRISCAMRSKKAHFNIKITKHLWFKYK